MWTLTVHYLLGNELHRNVTAIDQTLLQSHLYGSNANKAVARKMKIWY